MNNEMQDLASWTLEMAKSAGADDCRVKLDNERIVEIQYREKHPETLKEASRKELAIEIFVEGRYSRQNTSDLRRDALKSFLGNAVTMTKLLAKDPFRSLPDPQYFEGPVKKDLKIYDTDYENLTPEKRHELARNIEASCLEMGGENLVTVTAYVDDTRQESVLLSSNGFQGYQRATYFDAGAEVTLQDEGDRRPSNYYFLVSTRQTDVFNPEKIAGETIRRTTNLMGGKKEKTGTLPVIIENRVVPRIFYGFLEALMGRNIQQKQSFLADKKGTTVGSSVFTVIDDPLLPGGLGSQWYDDDGIVAVKRSIIENGVLKNFYLDWYYSRKLDMEPTTGSRSNLIIPAGTRTITEIMKDLGRGIFITGFIGGNSNSTTGDASVGILGQLFDKGEVVQPITEMNIAFNHLEVWQKLAETAADPWPYSSYKTPSLVFTDIMIAGS